MIIEKIKNIFNSASFKMFLKFTHYLLAYWKKQAAVIILSGAAVILGLANPYLSKLVIDKALINKDVKALLILAFTVGGIFILNGLTESLRSYLGNEIKNKVSFDLHKKVFKHLEALDIDYFQDQSTGEHIYKNSCDIDRVTDFITTGPTQFVSIFPKLLLILIIVFQLNWQMAVSSLCLAPLLYLPPYYLTKKMRIIWKDLFRSYETIFKRLNEIFSHMYLVKAFAQERCERRDYLRRRIAIIRASMNKARFEAVNSFSGNVINKIVIGLISFYGGYQVIKNQMTLGSLTAIMMYIGQLVGLQHSLARYFQDISLGLISCQRIDALLTKQPKIVEKKDAPVALFKKGGIVFKDVSFWHKSEEPVFRGLNFAIEGGTHIAFAGASGCGKTTLLNLILRLYEPQHGDIFIDGYNIKDMSFSCLRKQIGVVLQEPFLWNNTVVNNITYGASDSKEKGILHAAQMTGVDDFVKRLPCGYQSIIGENACKLSEGQKQRIAIARALIRQPKILILDEAMSSIDAQSEEKIISNIKNMQRDFTLLTVSHRLSSVIAADLVYFLSKTEKIIIGKAVELLQQNKEFCDLFSDQVKKEIASSSPTTLFYKVVGDSSQ